MSPDTDVFVLTVRRQPQLGDGVFMIVGTGDKWRLVPLQPIYDAIGPNVAQSLPEFHAFTGSDTTGRFTGKGKLTCWNTLLKTNQNVLEAFKQLGKENIPSKDACSGLEEFMCH